jgi:cyclase
MSKRRIALLALIVSAACLAFAQQTSAPKPVQLTTTKIADNIYTLTGAGGNMAFLVSDDGILLIDTAAAPLAPQIHAAIKAVSDKPIKYVFITHYHFDHVGSNEQLAKEATIIAQGNVRKRLSTDQMTLGRRFKALPAEAWPTITFSDEMDLYLNGEDVRFIHPLANAHTDGDSVVWFTKEHVVHMGDELFAGMFPVIDIDGGGNVVGLADAVDKIVAMVPPDTKFIAGHGPVCNATQMKEYSAFLRDSVAIVQAAIKQGKTLEQMKSENVLAKYEKLNGFIKMPQFTEFVYQSVTAKAAN